MNKQQAIQVLQSALNSMRLTLPEHQQLMQALQIATADSKPVPLEDSEKKKQK